MAARDHHEEDPEQHEEEDDEDDEPQEKKKSGRRKKNTFICRVCVLCRVILTMLKHIWQRSPTSLTHALL